MDKRRHISEFYSNSEIMEISRCAICTYNTQRNDASIIPGVVQHNCLAVDTLVKTEKDNKQPV